MNRADIEQKMRDAAANGASGKVEWCAGWLRGRADTLDEIERRMTERAREMDYRPDFWKSIDRIIADMRAGK